jgi:hypothetical protein
METIGKGDRIMDCFHETMIVPNDALDRLEELCRGPAVGCGRDETIFDREATFDDGCRMAIQVVAPNEPETESCWTQGVLFNPAGVELGFTEPGDSVGGEYRVETDDGIYTVGVEDGSKTTLLLAAANAMESFADTCDGDAGADAAYAADLAMRLRQLAKEIE